MTATAAPVTLTATRLTWTTEDGREVSDLWQQTPKQRAELESFRAHLAEKGRNPQTSEVTRTYAVGDAVRVEGHGRMRDGVVTAVGRTRITVDYVRNVAGDRHVQSFDVTRVVPVEPEVVEVEESEVVEHARFATVDAETITNRRDLLAAVEVQIRHLRYASAAAYLQAPGREVIRVRVEVAADDPDGPELPAVDDDPREQPEPVEWSEAAGVRA